MYEGFKRVKTVEVARQQCDELVVVLREDLSSLNFSLGDVAHAALCSRVLAARGSFGAVAGFGASYSMTAASFAAASLRIR